MNRRQLVDELYLEVSEALKARFTWTGSRGKQKLDYGRFKAFLNQYGGDWEAEVYEGHTVRFSRVYRNETSAKRGVERWLQAHAPEGTMSASMKRAEAITPALIRDVKRMLDQAEGLLDQVMIRGENIEDQAMEDVVRAAEDAGRDVSMAKRALAQLRWR